jgi:hypothetical protein
LMRFREWHMWSQKIWYMPLLRHLGEWRQHIFAVLRRFILIFHKIESHTTLQSNQIREPVSAYWNPSSGRQAEKYFNCSRF